MSGHFRLMKQKNTDYYKEYALKNKDKIKEYKKQYRLKNKEYYKEYRLNNKEKRKEYDILNKEYYKEYYKQYKKNKRKDPKFKLINNLRSRLHETLGGGHSHRSLEILGCSPEQLTQYLESQFQPWMTWENMGGRSVSTPNTTWDVDHIIPLSSAQTEEDVYRLNHYTNLQPMCSYHNRFIKRDSL